MDIDEQSEREVGEGYVVPSLDVQSTNEELANPENYEAPPGGTNANQTRRRTKLALALIFAAAALERVSFYCIQGNLEYILDQYFTETDAKNHVAWVLGAGQFLPLVGAWLGENKIGVYRSVAIGLIFELLACLLFLPPILETLYIEIKGEKIQLTTWMKASVILSYIFLIMGLALTRTNIMILAVQQIREENIIKHCFFLWFFWFIELGTAGGYMLSGMLEILPVPVLLATVLILILPCFVNGLCVRPSSHAFGVLYKSIRHKMPSVCKLKSTNIFNRLSESVQQNIVQHESDMERLFEHILRIALFTALHIVFEGLYGIQTIWKLQIILNCTNDSLDCYDTAYMSLIAYLLDSGSVLIITPFLHFILRRYWPAGLRQLRLMGCAMLLMSLSCVSEALLDKYEDDPYYYILYGIPPSICFGLAGIFAYAITYEFIYIETPEGLRNTMLGLYFCSMGLGVFLSSIIFFKCINQSENPRETSSRILLALAGLQLLVLAGYIVLARKYKYREQYERSVSAAIDYRADDFGDDNVSVSSSDSDGENYALINSKYGIANKRYFTVQSKL